MNIISGQNVDLITPFPPAEAHRVFGWNHCYRTLAEDDGVPVEREEFIAHVQQGLTQALTAGVIDLQQITSAKHEAPLVGILTASRLGPRGIILDFATGRKAFKMGLMEEGVQRFSEWLFGEFPEVLRITCLLDEGNAPVKSLLRRLGWKFEGVIRSSILKDGIPRSQVIFGLVREPSQPEVVIEDTTPVVIDSQEPVE